MARSHIRLETLIQITYTTPGQCSSGRGRMSTNTRNHGRQAEPPDHEDPTTTAYCRQCIQGPSFSADGPSTNGSAGLIPKSNRSIAPCQIQERSLLRPSSRACTGSNPPKLLLVLFLFLTPRAFVVTRQHATTGHRHRRPCGRTGAGPSSRRANASRDFARAFAGDGLVNRGRTRPCGTSRHTPRSS